MLQALESYAESAEASGLCRVMNGPKLRISDPSRARSTLVSIRSDEEFFSGSRLDRSTIGDRPAPTSAPVREAFA